ncbi:MAG: hypothetical protein ACUVXI_17215 [bacterium]
MKEGLKSLLSIQKDSIKGIIEAYESDLEEVNRALEEHRQKVAELERKKAELENALKIPRKHLSEIEEAESKAGLPSSEE